MPLQGQAAEPTSRRSCLRQHGGRRLRPNQRCLLQTRLQTTLKWLRAVAPQRLEEVP